jgi:hypothetical protein
MIFFPINNDPNNRVSLSFALEVGILVRGCTLMCSSRLAVEFLRLCYWILQMENLVDGNLDYTRFSGTAILMTYLLCSPSE